MEFIVKFLEKFVIDSIEQRAGIFEQFLKVIVDELWNKPWWTIGETVRESVEKHLIDFFSKVIYVKITGSSSVALVFQK